MAETPAGGRSRPDRLPLDFFRISFNPRAEIWGLPLFLALFAVTFTLLVFLVTIYQSLGADILPVAGVFIFLSAILWLIDPLLKEKFRPFVANVILIALYLILAQILMLVSGGVHSPFFLVYYFVVFTVAMSYGLTGAIIATVLIACAYATFIESSVDFPRYIVSIIVLWIIALMVGFLAETKKRVERRETLYNMRMTALEEIARFMRELAEPEDVVEAGLEATLRLLAADGVWLVRDDEIVCAREISPGRVSPRQGESFPIELDGRPHRFVIARLRHELSADERRIVRLLTDKIHLIHRHLQDRALMEAARVEKERVLDSIGTAVLIVTREGLIKSANRRAVEILELAAAPVGSVSLCAAPILAPPLEGWGAESREVELHSLAGRAVPVAMKVFPQLNEQQVEIGWIVVFDDLREVRRLEAVLRRSEALAAVGEMAARVAHEVRNPLGGILGFLGLAERQATPAIKRYLAEASGAVRRLEAIVQDLLTFSRPVTSARSRFSFAEAWRGMVEAEIARNAESPSSAALNIQELGPEFAGVAVKGDVSLFGRIVGNLLRNAREAVGDNGYIAVRARLGGTAVWIEIDDNGPGCPADIVDKIFEPFISSKASGSGLGLTIARRTIEELGGSIRYLRTTDECGPVTRFRLSWPRAE